MDSAINCVTCDNRWLCQISRVKEEMKPFNEKVKEVIGIFDGSLVLQLEADEPEEALFVLVPEDGLTQDEDLENHVDGQDFDPLIHATIILPDTKGGDMMAKVLGQKNDTDNNLVGCKNCIITLDTQCYEVKFLDGEHQHIAYNLITEHLLSGIDSKSNQFQIFKEIVDHSKDHHAVEIANQYTSATAAITRRR